MRSNVFPSIFIFAILSLVILVGCVQEMGKNGHLRPLDGTRATLNYSRVPPESTVAQNSEPRNASDISESTTLKEKMFSKETLLKGKTLYETNCMPCHGMSGYGDGMVVKRGFLAPPSYHIDRLRTASDEHIFDVISHGYGAMYSYAARVNWNDRWAIVAYIRALQLSQNASVTLLTSEEKNHLSEEVSK